MYSCPGVKFLLNGGPPATIAGGPWLITSRSLAQIAHASTRTSTSAGPGWGTGLSARVSWPGSPRTQAFIVCGTIRSSARCDVRRVGLRRLIDLFERQKHRGLDMYRSAGIDRHRGGGHGHVVRRIDDED